MAGSKTINRVCCLAIAVMLILTAVVWGGKAAAGKRNMITVGYEGLFDTSYVHTIDIGMADWDGFISSATQETYAECSVTIDGEKISGVGIRAKGNTSLSSVATMDSRKHSFKIEFDQFTDGKTYHGLDKLSLNNMIYDATMMKDYLAYTLMSREGVPSPLCSYVQVTVNGEPWGLYLAVEGVENGFMERNNMTTGELYKPDSLSFGGGRGNGRDFDFDQFRVKDEDESENPDTEGSGTDAGSAGQTEGSGNPFGAPPSGFGGESFSGTTPPDGTSLPEGFQMPEGMSFSGSFQPPAGADAPGDFKAEEEEDGSENPGTAEDTASSGRTDSGRPSPGGDGFFSFGGGMFNFGMGSSDVKLQYIDDDPDSYSNIFDNAKTRIGKKDKTRLIETLKTLNGEKAEDAVDADEVIRYLAVHDFLQNDDSYTGMMVHNYYLYEENGKLFIIPWDYNLAFGGMSSGSGASSVVNSPIDTPVSNGTGSDRPLISWIFSDGDALERYHEVYSEFIADVIESGWLAEEITRVAEMIRSYVDADENSFYTAEEFDTAVDALQSYCGLRGESIRGQLDGTIPSTSEGQRADSSALVDTGSLSLSDMGVMNTGGGGPGGGGPGGSGMPSMPGGGSFPDFGSFQTPENSAGEGKTIVNPFESGSSGEMQSSGNPFGNSGFRPPENAAGEGQPFGNPFGSGSAMPGSFSGTAPETASGGNPALPEGFPQEAGTGRGAGGTDWMTFGACLALLLGAILIAARVRGNHG